ncbi:hypothetical protein AD11_5323 [Escherichia coli 1-250-04_S4_C2]|nr:hypothetical protein AD11_5323 [Escherichia coli 1-250-04_S4_C2]
MKYANAILDNGYQRQAHHLSFAIFIAKHLVYIGLLRLTG